MEPSPRVEGQCDPRFAPVREEFARGFGELADDPERGEIGAALSVVVHGRTVVDLWGGYSDTSRTQPWQRDTLANLYSTTKGMTAVVVHQLVDDGLVDLDAPLARWWPAFAQAGKADVQVACVLSHRAGLPALRRPLPASALYDQATLATALAAETPWWEPGVRHGYHAFTFGWLLGELVRRASGDSLGRLLRQRLTDRLGLDLHLGVGRTPAGRVAEVTPLPFEPGSEAAAVVERVLSAPTSATALAFANPPGMLAPGVANSAEWRGAEIPAANGHGTARALAELYGALAAGGLLDGEVVLQPESITRCHTGAPAGADEVLPATTRFSLGFMMSSRDADFGPGAATFGHPGAGGSLGLADPDSGLGFGYVPNRMGSHIILDPRPAACLAAAYACL